jgi:hypothetical protein
MCVPRCLGAERPASLGRHETRNFRKPTSAEVIIDAVSTPVTLCLQAGGGPKKVLEHACLR